MRREREKKKEGEERVGEREKGGKSKQRDYVSRYCQVTHFLFSSNFLTKCIRFSHKRVSAISPRHSSNDSTKNVTGCLCIALIISRLLARWPRTWAVVCGASVMIGELAGHSDAGIDPPGATVSVPRADCVFVDFEPFETCLYLTIDGLNYS